jgi:hypothetical protein
MKIPLILRCAAWIAPIEDRPEWLAEWGGELAYVRHTCGRAQMTAFCLGAFPDALWLRRNHLSARGVFCIESPLRCLAFLAILAAASVSSALWCARGSNLMGSAPYRDPEKLAMISRRPGVAPRFAEIPVEEYQSWSYAIPGATAIAFYMPVAACVHSRIFAVAVASPNLFELLGVPPTASGLILGRRAWRKYFGGDPHVVGRMVQVGSSPAMIAGIVSDGVWQLPGPADAWLLDASRVAALPAGSRGFVVARLGTAASRTDLRWRMSTPNERGTFNIIGVAPLPHENPIVPLFVFIAGTLLLLSATTSLSLGDYPSSRFSPPWVWVRRWLFLVVKIALLLPIVLFALFGLAMVFPPTLQGCLIGVILALRWALLDQRSRCPVCLRSLSHPVRIGEASHTFLAWYGTELLCTRGHGLLHVPEIRTSCYAEQRWLYLDPSWTG